MNSLGRHILVEFIGCNPDILNDVAAIESGMITAAKDAGATVIQSSFHHFSPYGVSGVVVIQESHLAIHTWPEYQYAAVDLFTCGTSVDPWVSFDHLRKAFQAQNYSALEMYRGALSMLKRAEYTLTSSREEMEKKVGTQFQRNLWFTDKDQNQAFSLRYTKDILFNQKSPYQTVRVYDTEAYGKMLAIDDMIMCTERDEAHYHEMIVHPAFQLHGHAKNVLVIGGGDGGTIREVLKYPSVEKATMVEIDEVVVEASKKYLPTLASSFGDPRLDLKIGDGIDFVAKAKAETYDVIIVDGSDPAGPAEGLFSKEFWQNCHRCLKKDGIVVTQGESPMFHQQTFVDLNQCLKDVFGAKRVFTSLFFATSYPSGMWSIKTSFKSDKHPIQDFQIEKAKQFVQKNPLQYYNEGVHVGAFNIPTFVKKLLNEL
ncbi:MAG: spermidine synthase [Bdellovibrio sp. CG10_big_fil_rev_8_21_14_0_10_47_8]|nr:MAG: spermidine synthase [Bdellovibrio sp. CG10_big_fil_rev_8_21_14_0_10_47_8]